MPYQQFDNDSIQNQLPLSLVRLHRILKALSQCQVLLGLVSAALASLYLLNDGVFGIFSVGIFIGIYYAITGFIGICGSASFRRGLVSAYMVMCCHAAIICVPVSIVINALAINLDNRGCIMACRTEDLTCGMTCQGDAEWNWIPNEAGRSIDIAQIGLAIIELGLTIACAVICCAGTCDRFGIVNELSSIQIMRYTREGKNAIKDKESISSIEEPSQISVVPSASSLNPYAELAEGRLVDS